MTEGGRGVGEGFGLPAVSGAWRARVGFVVVVFAVACLVSRVLLVAPVPVGIGLCDCDWKVAHEIKTMRVFQML